MVMASRDGERPAVGRSAPFRAAQNLGVADSRRLQSRTFTILGFINDLAETFIDIPETFIDIPETFIDIPETFIDIPETFIDIPETFIDIPERLFVYWMFF